MISKADPTPVTCSMTPLLHCPHNILCIPTERLPFHFSLACIGEGNGNPLQCSFLENPRNGGAWWAAIYGVTRSWARLKWFSSSIVSYLVFNFFFPQMTTKTLASFLPMLHFIINCGKLLKRWLYQTILPVSWETCMRVKKQHLEPCMEQLVGSRLKKE